MGVTGEGNHLIPGNSDNPSRILVVDDCPTNLTLLERVLRNAGYQVFTAHDGKDTMALAKQHDADLVLLDVIMPGCGGLEACRLLKSDPATAAIPVIFVTANSEPSEVVEGFLAGGCDYITKPFILPEVLARVSVHLALRRTEKELRRRTTQLETLSSQLSETNVELAVLARTDALTGLPNRRSWQEAAAMEEARARRHASPFSILMVDIDHFKKYNDTRGHFAGDSCLRSVADCLRTTCRGPDTVGRYGGEEFIILAPETNAAGALEMGARICEAVRNLKLPHPSSPTTGYITVSVGVATGMDEDWADIARKADDALYAAKEAGRNCHRAASPELAETQFA